MIGDNVAINVGPPQSAGPGGIPTKYLIIGAGALGLGLLLLMQKKTPAAVDPNSGDVQPTGSTSAQLSSVQQLQLSQFGELTKLFQAQSDLVQGQVSGLSSHLDTQAATLSSQLAAGFTTSAQGQSQIYNAQAAQYSNLAQAIWQTFMRASNPAWMPGDPGNPWTPPPEHVAQTSIAVGGA